ncbi:NAD(P)-binding protein [Streptomyces goshikiensis]|uniref:NAD(P)-binding protein n=1 Tax=Streptomyces goshikiensis TaxID=1942 RepID=UPI003677F7E5
MSGLSVDVVVGAGVAGPPAASVLSRGQGVVLHEAEDRLGGHAHPYQSRTARPAAVRVSHDPDRPRGFAAAGPHPVTPHANGHHEGAVPAGAVHEQPVRPRSVPETREGLL